MTGVVGQSSQPARRASQAVVELPAAGMQLQPRLEPTAEEQGAAESSGAAVFLYFFVNLLWVVATFFLQAIGSDVISIRIPKYYPNGTLSDDVLKVEPLSLMFLLSFAVLLLVQFLAMLYHRVYTLIHVVAYRSKEKDYKEREEDAEEDGMAYTNHSMSNGLMIDSDDLT
ncbi:hypothetical protein CRUP_022376 [Coryphaenoides rupestris]|nr:hypothetical protein CRUP_022376 [Coryphaenoides rupestris]